MTSRLNSKKLLSSTTFLRLPTHSTSLKSGAKLINATNSGRGETENTNKKNHKIPSVQNIHLAYLIVKCKKRAVKHLSITCYLVTDCFQTYFPLNPEFYVYYISKLFNLYNFGVHISE